MNIGIDIRALSTKSRTGVGNYIFNVIKNLGKENNYYLLSAGSSKIKKIVLDELNDVLENNSNMHHIHLRVSNKILNLSLLLKAGPDLTKLFPVKLDLFWLPNINFYKFNNNIPVLLTIHDLSFLHSKKFYSLKRKIWHSLINVRKLVNKVDKIIVVSKNTKIDIIRFFLTETNKVKVIYPGIDIIKINKEKALKITNGYDLKKKYFIYIGTLEPRKNILSIIKGFDKYHKEYPDVELLIIGGKGWMYRDIIKRINKKSYIRHLGYISGEEKAALYYLSQGLIWPSFYEGFGFPLLEATYYNIPVIASYKTSLPEIIKKQALYIDPFNSAEVYQILKILTEDKELRSNIIENSKDFKIFNWEEQIKKIINYFKYVEKNSN